MRRRTVQPETWSFVSVLWSPVTPLDRSKTKNATVLKSATFLATESANSAPFKRKERCKFLARKMQNSLPTLRCTFLARKSAKLIANFSTTKVTSLPSISVSLSLSLSLSHQAHLTHNIESAYTLPIIQVLKTAWGSEIDQLTSFDASLINLDCS